MTHDGSETDGGWARNVVAVTQDDPFFTGRFFAAFVPESRRLGITLLEIVLLPNFNESKVALARRMLGFYGLGGVLRLAARYAGTKASDLRGAPRSVAALARGAAIPVRELSTINDPEYLATLRERDVDVLLSVSAPEIFREDALAAAPHVLNVHSGKLPKYRGMMPTFWALLAGDDHVTVTVHEMVERLDAGRILLEHDVPVGRNDTLFEVAARAKQVAGSDVARLFASNRPRGREPSAPEGPPYSFPGRDDVRRLRARGRRLL